MIVYCTVLAPCVSSRAAFAAYKRFGRRPKPWRRGGFADPERSDTEGGGAALLGGETQKERHLLKADVFLFGFRRHWAVGPPAAVKTALPTKGEPSFAGQRIQ